MYITDFICTYKQHDINDQNVMYQQQLLQAFNLDAWDDDIVNTSVKEIYEKIKDNQDINDILNKIKNDEKYIYLGKFIYELWISYYNLLIDFNNLKLNNLNNLNFKC